ncbi:adaptin ear-binding coat-associated protein 1 [Amanita rubescens]|nr:adaptin ear-binding coat-associated protein 1 [Amanita rubescens]
MDDDDIESILYIAREVSVFKIPPLKVNEGHRASDWGDLGNPLWKGRLRIIERSQGVGIQFEDATTAVFAKTMYDPDRPSVEAVLDSSRYFVIRVEDDGRKAYIGMGFLERSESFDFNVALQDYTKRFRAKQNPSLQADQTTPQASGPKKDYSLKEGQTFSIKLPGRDTTEKSLLNAKSSTSGSSGGGVPLLPPPPSVRKS